MIYVLFVGLPQGMQPAHLSSPTLNALKAVLQHPFQGRRSMWIHRSSLAKVFFFKALAPHLSGEVRIVLRDKLLPKLVVREVGSLEITQTLVASVRNEKITV